MSYGSNDIGDNQPNSATKIFFALKFNKALCCCYYNLVSKLFRLRLFTLFTFSYLSWQAKIEINENFQRHFLSSSDLPALNDDHKRVIFARGLEN